MSMKNFNDTIGNRAHDILACSAVPQPTAPPLKSKVENVQHCLGGSADMVHDQARAVSLAPCCSPASGSSQVAAAALS